MKNVGIIDYGMGNIQSISNSLNFNSINSDFISISCEIKKYDTIILPGVGAFGKAMKNLETKNFIEPLIEHVLKEKKIIGICLGMQLLFEKSYEFGEYKGLGFIKGKVLPFESKINLRVPHVGWNNSSSNTEKYRNFSGDYYFVHSFYCKPHDTSDILFQTIYGTTFCSGIQKGNIYGLQFHPEKSHDLGLNLLKEIIFE